MNFDLNLKKELNELIKSRSLFSNDEEYCYQFIDIINDASFLPKKVKLVKNSNTRALAANCKTYDIKYNTLGTLNYIEKVYRKHKKYFFDGDLNQFCDYLLPFCLIHELTHVYQFLCGDGIILESQEINRLYEKILIKIRQNGFVNYINYIKYIFSHDYYCYERYANIVASNSLVEVFEGTDLDFYSKLSQINMLLRGGYSVRNEKVCSPVNRTCKYLGIKDDLEEADLPFKDLFEHGFKIKDQDYDYLYAGIISNQQVDYDDVIEKIKTLVKRDSRK